MKDKETKLNQIWSEKQEIVGLINALNLPELQGQLKQNQDSISEAKENIERLKRQEVEMKEGIEESKNQLQAHNDQNLQLEQQIMRA